ncbi:hypothetical protein CY652_23605 [Burkholderia sp. WAC0059]|nr:hypothetical protein CY652_23605 [Burkholderia sp. WAC0059]
MAYRQTWAVKAYAPYAYVSHDPTNQVAWAAGISIGRGPLSLTYQYLPDRAPWNPYPGIVEKMHLLKLTGRIPG